MLLSLTIAHCEAHRAGNSQPRQNLEGVGVVAGRRVLRHLDQLQNSGGRGSTPGCSSTQTPEIAKANVLILLGTIMAVYYTTGPDSSREFDILDSETASYRPSTVWNAMKEHVCSMLTHHLLFVAAPLGFTVPLNVERMLIRRCIRLWDKTPKFSWVLMKSECGGHVGLSPETQMNTPDSPLTIASGDTESPESTRGFVSESRQHNGRSIQGGGGIIWDRKCCTCGRVSNGMNACCDHNMFECLRCSVV